MKTRFSAASLKINGAFFLFSIGTVALGQTVPGVTDKEIKIGSCSALEGPSHFLGTQPVTGASSYFDLIN